MGFLKGLLIRLGCTALAFWLATLLIPGITLNSDSVAETVTTLVLVAVIFGVVNAVLQPIIKTVGCGFYLLTLGLIALVVNGLLLPAHELDRRPGRAAVPRGRLLAGRGARRALRRHRHLDPRRRPRPRLTVRRRRRFPPAGQCQRAGIGW